jgi:hypothetical protein
VGADLALEVWPTRSTRRRAYRIRSHVDLRFVSGSRPAIGDARTVADGLAHSLAWQLGREMFVCVLLRFSVGHLGILRGQYGNRLLTLASESCHLASCS